ncbi:hypothetical protein MPH_13173 [Macrophomina phaseolina MS6]|uniref:N-alpha-acetyltransferase 40 n=1 Tax=Macrophomina phaseolina (strain MS6) TaxID=1126212 RepID=K2RZ56_MACPH|nr:hypothetical protein MPH_13173 [Macrophomina phaseolina MS6]
MLCLSGAERSRGWTGASGCFISSSTSVLHRPAERAPLVASTRLPLRVLFFCRSALPILISAVILSIMAAGALKRPRRPKTDPETLIDRINALSPAAFAQRFFPPSSTLLRYRDYEITLKSVTTIADGDFSSCFKLVESTSAADYKSSSRGWRPRDKLREMREDHMRYLLVRESRSHPAKSADSDRASHDGEPSELDTSTVGNDIVAFCSFMFTIEDDYPVVYIYEIHLAESHRRSGLGRHLMRIVEHCATEGAVDKAMLTCFRCNTLAMAFYTKLGYEEDEFSPPAKRLRGGKIKLPSYLIMSKRVG